MKGERIIFKNKMAYFKSRKKEEKDHGNYLVTIPVQSASIFLKSAVEKNDGSLQISFVTGLNSESPWKCKLINSHYWLVICSYLILKVPDGSVDNRVTNCKHINGNHREMICLHLILQVPEASVGIRVTNKT